MKKINKNIIPDRALASQIESKALSGGYAILELLFYISFFATLSLVVIDAMIIMSKSFKETSIYSELVQSAAVMERMSRDIRQAISINSISASDLVLNSGVNKTTEFKFVSSNIELWENTGTNTLVGNLNSPNITVTDLSFTEITTAKGKAVKVILSFRSNNDSLARVQTFYDTIVLRGSY